MKLMCILALMVLVASPCCYGQTGVSKASEDGTQEGSIEISEDGRSGTVSSSSRGTNRASARSSLVIGPDTAQGSFSTRGDEQSVADTVVVGDDPVETTTPVEKEEKSVDDTQVEEEETITVDDQSVPEEVEKQEVAEKETESPVVVVPERLAGEQEVKKVCVIGDESEFQKQLKMGNEVTLVKATRDESIEIKTALVLPHASTQTTIVTEYIPADIRDRCDVSYEDLGLEDRAGDGFSTITDTSSSFQFSSISGSAAAAESTQAIRSRVMATLCKQDFFRAFVLFDACKQYDAAAQGVGSPL